MNCPNCGFPVDGRNLPRTCPKCDEDLIRAKARRPLQVDLAHSGETVETALRKLEAAVSECLWHGHASLKVIHGYGSKNGASTTAWSKMLQLRGRSGFFPLTQSLISNIQSLFIFASICVHSRFKFLNESALRGRIALPWRTFGTKVPAYESVSTFSYTSMFNVGCSMFLLPQ